MYKLISELLNEFRIKRGYTQQQLSDRSGIPLGTVKTILSGATTNPGFTNTCLLITSMDVSVDEFFCILTDRVPTEKVPAQPVPPPLGLQPTPKIDISEDVRNATTEAIEKVLSAEYTRTLRRDITYWRIATIVLIVAFVGWLLWDIRHPGHGLIQYESFTVRNLKSFVDTLFS